MSDQPSDYAPEPPCPKSRSMTVAPVWMTGRTCDRYRAARAVKSGDNLNDQAWDIAADSKETARSLRPIDVPHPVV